MTTEHDLLQAILDAEPDDAELRLIYADLLQQRGDPRGELIAMQVARTDDAVEERERKLLDDHEAAWLGPWQGRAEEWRFRRGFLHELKVPLDAFVEIARGLAPPSEHLAFVRELRLVEPRLPGEDTAVLARELVGLAAPLRITALTLQLALHERVVTELARGQFLQHVERLQLVPVTMSAPAFAWLTRSPHLSAVSTLELRNANLDDDALAELASTRLWREVRVFANTAKYASACTAVGVQALLATNGRLVSLDLSGQYGIDDGVLGVIARAAPPLELLALAYARLRTPAMAQIASLTTLRSLDVRHTLLDDAALAPILALRRLQSLNIAHTRMTAAAALVLLREAPRTLRDLTITLPNLSPVVVDQLRARFDLHRWR